MKTQLRLQNIGGFNYPSPDIKESALVEVSQRIREQFGVDTVVEPKRYSIDQVLKKLLAIYHGDQSFSDLSRKEHRLAPWVFFLVTEDEGLIDLEGFIEGYLKFLVDNEISHGLSNWIHVFLLYYPSKKSSFSSLCAHLSSLFHHASGQKNIRLKHWVETNSILSVDGSKKFAQVCLQGGVKNAFDSYRLVGNLSAGRFAVLGLTQALSSLSSSFSSKKANDQKFFLDSLFEQVLDGDEFVYPTLRTVLANGLLQSFIRKPAQPEIKKYLKGFFVKFYGDIRTEKTKWSKVSESAQQVMQQWMVENTLHDFFALLTHVARYDSTADLHWEYRKRFWNAYLKKGVISEAWVALGPVAYHEAKDFLKGDRNVYAKLSGAQNRHSSLIMVINGVLITEWSHSGRFRLWDSEHGRPSLYKKHYHRDELVYGFDYEGNHSGSVNGSWQHTLSTRIAELTGIKVGHREYMYD